jgi:methylmalonyl-CoA mutase
MRSSDPHRAPRRVVTAASLFDGHDAAIHLMRRLLQDAGAEVIHLGHDRSVEDVVVAAIQEDAHAVAISSYQGGHMEYFRYLRRLLDEGGAHRVRIFGGGGGVIVPEEIRELEAGVVDRIYSPEDGRRLGLEGMILDLLSRCAFDARGDAPPAPADVEAGAEPALARLITWCEAGVLPDDWRERLLSAPRSVPVIGITGTGGAGKSSLTDELARRWLLDHDQGRVAVISVDPTRRRTGGALLGDRIRMNAIVRGRVFVRSLATRGEHELSGATSHAIAACRLAGFDLVFVETSGIGQGDAAITDVADVSLYVMTPEFGAPSQLEKIEMLDVADFVAVNKLEKRGGLDAVRAVRRQVRRNRKIFDGDDEALPVYGTVASRFADPGVTSLYHGLMDAIDARSGRVSTRRIARPASKVSPLDRAPIGPGREHYLSDIARAVRDYHTEIAGKVEAVRQDDAIARVAGALEGPERDRLAARTTGAAAEVRRAWDALVAQWSGREYVYEVRGKPVRQPAVRDTLSGTPLPRVALPDFDEPGAQVRFLMKENVPGSFPFTAGVFPLKRLDEEPKRMFAGEGGPAKTNSRFHYLCRGEAAHRLSTAFDSVTLYGRDPAVRPDIYGKVGESGVSVPHLDDMKILYGGFDLLAPTTSVSMTINGPAPMLLAMFFNTAIDQQVDRFVAETGRAPTEDERQRIAAAAVQNVRGTVQADILKEDQAQNTCIFSTPFALRLMGDVQEWFVQNDVRNFYSVSVSGYHIAEAGANPVSQLAFTLSNGFTLVEYFLNRGLAVDDVAPNLSFFFSNGLDAEYTVIGRVARRIWSVAMRDRYGASERSQKLKYHIQTSGRSLHAREIAFNDIRTTLQALLAIGDHCNSLHTNAYDEAITTPTEESVRRAMAIQLIINRELGLAHNENPLQGSHLVEWLTDRVEEAVLQEFERLDARGGVLGAMELMYQRTQIQEESLLYERLKHDGTLPIIGVNTFLDPATVGADWVPPTVELRRATPAEKDDQVESVRRFQAAHAHEAPAALARLRQVALDGGNVFAELMSTVRVATLGQISEALFDVGGAYRRNV